MTCAARALLSPQLAMQIEHSEDQRNRTKDDNQRRAIEEEELPPLKAHLEVVADEERQWWARANEAGGAAER